MEGKKRKLTAMQHLRVLADELSQLSDVFMTQTDKSTLSSVSLADLPAGMRLVDVPKQKQSQASSSLLSFTTKSSAHTTTDAKEKDQWKERLPQAAHEVASFATQDKQSAIEQASRLVRRYESVVKSVEVLEKRVKTKDSDAFVQEKVEQQLEREEHEWETQMKAKEQAIAELEVELKSLTDTNAQFQRQMEEMNEEQDERPGAEQAAKENASLRQILALRMEEKRDLEAAVRSLERKKRRQSLTASPATTNQSSKMKQQRLQQIQALEAQKAALQQEILGAEAVNKDKNDRSNASDPIQNSQRDALVAELQEETDALARVKSKMKQMVDLHLATATVVREEAVIIQLLYASAGEMTMNDLKQEAAKVLSEKTAAASSSSIIRALYSLVANGIVQIDRSVGSGLVTLLLL